MAVYYVDPQNGNDSNTGLNPTTQQWLTTQKALDNVAVTDEVRLMNTQTETLSATLTETTNAAEETAIKFIGADSNGDPLTTGVYTISANGLGANLYNTTQDYYIWERVRFTDADATYVNISETGNVAANHLFKYCRIDNAGSHGVILEAQGWQFIECEIDNNGGMGIHIDTVNRANAYTAINCDVHGNTSHGIEIAGSYNTIYGNRFYLNGGNGIYILRYCGFIFIHANVFFNNTSSGLRFQGAEASQSNVRVFNNIFDNNGAYGMSVDASYEPVTWFIDNNQYDDNTSGAVDWLGIGYSDAQINGNGFGTSNVTGDPLFTSVTPGAEDFTLQSGSSCTDVGFGYGTKWDIGAAQSSPGAGGSGGLLMANKRGNKQ